MTSSLLNPGQLWLGVVRASDEEGFQLLLSTLLKDGIDPGSFTRGPIEASQDDPEKVSTVVKVARAKADISLWPYTDSTPISYKRVKLADVLRYFGGEVRVDLPTTVKDLMSVYFTQNQLHDRADQIEDFEVQDIGVIEISAIPGMAFIEGNASIEVKPFQRALDEVLSVTTIPGFRSAADVAQSNHSRFLFDQLVEANPDLRYPLDFDLMEISSPTMISGYAHDNTTVDFLATGEGNYKGNVTLTYTRHDFGWMTGGNQHYMEGPSIPTTAFMIQKVSEITGFSIRLQDVVVEEYRAIPSGELETLTIFFQPDSLQYAGELTIDYRAV